MVNATPLGMDGGAGGLGRRGRSTRRCCGPGQVVVDLVYHPPATPWLEAARPGGPTANGLGMLVHQAALQIGRWTGHEAPVEAMWAAVAGQARRRTGALRVPEQPGPVGRR